jgi:hypothetical protein
MAEHMEKTSKKAINKAKEAMGMNKRSEKSGKVDPKRPHKEEKKATKDGD